MILHLPPGHTSLLPVIERCDNASLPSPYEPAAVDEQERLVPFYIAETDKQPIGYLRPAVVQALKQDNINRVSKSTFYEICWKIMRSDGSDNDTDTLEGVDIVGIAFKDWINAEGRDARTEHINRVALEWSENGLFMEPLQGWRHETLSIYDVRRPVAGQPPDVAFLLERAATCLFGLAVSGVHLTAYVQMEGQYYIWTPRRAKTKPTWPGYLDNSAAGAIAAGYGPTDSIIREAQEEASLPDAYVRNNIRAAGLVSYIYRTKSGYVRPEKEYVYDLRMPTPLGFAAGHSLIIDSKTVSGSRFDGASATEDPSVLKPNDGEVQDFTLMRSDEVLQRLLNQEFKYNSAYVLVDFFVRHGLITPESEPNYVEICQRLRRAI